MFTPSGREIPGYSTQSPPPSTTPPITQATAQRQDLLRAHARNVTVQFQNGTRRANGQGGWYTGTGFCVSTNGSESLILTNRHIVESVYNGLGHVWHGRHHANFSVVSISKTHDLALVKTSLRFDEVATISERDGLLANEDVITFGFPKDAGILGRLALGAYIKRDSNVWVYPNEYYDGNGARVIVEYEILSLDITSLHAPGGASGSAIFDDSGRVVGIVFGYNPETLYAHSITARNIRRFLRSRGVVNAAYGLTGDEELLDQESPKKSPPVAYTTEGGMDVLVQKVKPRLRRSYPEEANAQPFADYEAEQPVQVFDSPEGPARSSNTLGKNAPDPLPEYHLNPGTDIPRTKTMIVRSPRPKRTTTPLSAAEPTGAPSLEQQREDSNTRRTSYYNSPGISPKMKLHPTHSRVRNPGTVKLSSLRSLPRTSADIAGGNALGERHQADIGTANTLAQFKSMKGLYQRLLKAHTRSSELTSSVNGPSVHESQILPPRSYRCMKRSTRQEAASQSQVSPHHNLRSSRFLPAV